MKKTISLTFLENHLEISLSGIDYKREIFPLWEDLTEDFHKWSSGARKRQITKEKNLAEFFHWEGMSTWWFNPLSTKDTDIDNRWLHQLMIVYICNKFDCFVSILTDDEVIKKAINKNFSNKNISINLEKKNSSLRAFLSLKSYKTTYFYLKFFYSLLLDLQRYIITKRFYRKQLEGISKINLTNIWFRTIFPANWMKDKQKFAFDKNYLFSPLGNKDRKSKTNYLVFVRNYNKKYSFNHLLRMTNSLSNNSYPEVFYPEAHLSILDLFNSYFSTYNERRRFTKLKGTVSFKSFFFVNNIDVSEILLQEWDSVYSGEMQFYKLNGLSIKKFFGKIKPPQIIVSYAEFFSQVRAEYFFLKKFHNKSKVIAMQHATNSKRKMFTFYLKDEFNYNSRDFINFMPYPDFFLAQGEQYKALISSFYPSEKIKVIGSVKYDDFALINERKTERKTERKKICLIILSGNDYKTIFNIFSEWKNPKDWKVIVAPHPLMDVTKIKKYILNNYPNLELFFNYDSRTSDLIIEASLVITGKSSMTIEALFFNVKSIIFMDAGSFPNFNLHDEIPLFNSHREFLDWFEMQDWESKDHHISYPQNRLIADYFYCIDGKAQERMWDAINLVKNSMKEQ